METIDAKWHADDQRYVVDPSDTPCDCAGTVQSGWWSEDGNNWRDFGGGMPAGDFDAVTIRLVGGPKDGTLIS